MKIGKFIAGVGIGTVIGMLLAPKKGSELREDIKRESLKAYDQLKNMTKEGTMLRRTSVMLSPFIPSVRYTVIGIF